MHNCGNNYQFLATCSSLKTKCTEWTNSATEAIQDAAEKLEDSFEETFNLDVDKSEKPESETDGSWCSSLKEKIGDVLEDAQEAIEDAYEKVEDALTNTENVIDKVEKAVKEEAQTDGSKLNEMSDRRYLVPQKIFHVLCSREHVILIGKY